MDTNNNIQILDVNKKKIKKINVDKFLPGSGRKSIKKIGIASKAFIVSIIGQLLQIPVLSDVIKTIGTAASGLFSANLVTAIVSHFYPAMEEKEYNEITNAIVNNYTTGTALTPEQANLAQSELYLNTRTNMQVVQDAVCGKGECGWVGILVNNVSGFIATHPELVIAGGAVLASSLVVLAKNIANKIENNNRKKKILKNGNNVQIETLTSMKKLLENNNFKKTKHHRKFAKLFPATLYVIEKTGNVSYNFLFELNKLLNNINIRLNNNTIDDLKTEYERLETMLKSISIRTNDKIDEHNKKIDLIKKR